MITGTALIYYILNIMQQHSGQAILGKCQQPISGREGRWEGPELMVGGANSFFPNKQRNMRWRFKYYELYLYK